MTSTSDANPFKACVNWMKNTQEADGNSPFSSCLIDACNNDGAGLKKVTCSALEEFEEQCVENGYPPPEKNKWRVITSCCKFLLGNISCLCRCECVFSMVFGDVS